MCLIYKEKKERVFGANLFSTKTVHNHMFANSDIKKLVFLKEKRLNSFGVVLIF